MKMPVCVTVTIGVVLHPVCICMPLVAVGRSCAGALQFAEPFVVSRRMMNLVVVDVDRETQCSSITVHWFAADVPALQIIMLRVYTHLCASRVDVCP